MSILVLRGGALGDFLLTAPALIALRKSFTGEGLSLVANPQAGRLALWSGLADRFRSLEDAPFSRLFAPARPDEELTAFLGSFERVLSYLHDPDGRVASNLALCGIPHVHCASPLVSDGHAIDHFLAPLRELGVAPPCGATSRIPLPAAWRQDASDALPGQGRDLLAIHPGSGSPAKNWPVQRFLELAEEVARGGRLAPVFFCGEADEAARAEIARQRPGGAIICEPQITRVAAMLACCRGYVGNDSGITHLAAALGTPTVALFGPTDPQTWAPRGPHVRVLRAAEPTTAGLAAITVEETLAALQECTRSQGLH